MQNNLTIVIPAATYGKRMKSYGPKALLRINKDTIILNQIQILKDKWPEANIVVTVGFEKERFYLSLPQNINIASNELYETTSVTKSILYGLYHGDDNSDIMIVYGDLFFNKETVKDLTLDSSFAIIDTKRQFGDLEVGLITDGKYIEYFEYSFNTKWAQIAFLKGKDAEKFRILLQNKKYKNFLTHEIVNEMINTGSKIEAIEPNEMKIVEVDTAHDIDRAKALGLQN